MIVEVASFDTAAVGGKRHLIHLEQTCENNENSHLIPAVAVALEIIHKILDLGAYAHTLVAVDLVENLSLGIVHCLGEECSGFRCVDDSFKHGIVIVNLQHAEIAVDFLNQPHHAFVEACADVGRTDICQFVATYI